MNDSTYAERYAAAEKEARLTAQRKATTKANEETRHVRGDTADLWQQIYDDEELLVYESEMREFQHQEDIRHLSEDELMDGGYQVEPDGTCISSEEAAAREAEREEALRRDAEYYARLDALDDDGDDPFAEDNWEATTHQNPCR